MDLNCEAGSSWKTVGALKTSSVSERRHMSVLGGAVMAKGSVEGSSFGTEAPFIEDQSEVDILLLNLLCCAITEPMKYLA